VISSFYSILEKGKYYNEIHVNRIKVNRSKSSVKNVH